MNESTAPSRIRIKQGLNLPIAGRPEQVVYDGEPVRHVALCGPDYQGLKPRLLVAEGDTVSLGQPLFIDKRDPAVNYVSPGTGIVTAINRGARRVLESVVIRLEDEPSDAVSFEASPDEEISRLEPGLVAEQMQKSGLWTAFRTRPFNRVPQSGSWPRSIFVTAIDTRPLAADPRAVIGQAEAEFAAGLQLVAKLAQKSLYLCTAPGWDIDLPAIDNLQRVEFSGPHPAGLPGTHIHFLDPVNASRVVWHLGCQDVIAIGRFFMSGVLDTRRIVALGGSNVIQPRLVATRLGACITELVDGSISQAEETRLIAGSLLDGRTASGNLVYLGRYQHQLTAIPEAGSRHLFGWTGLSPRLYTAAPTLLRKMGHKRRHDFSTAQNGRFSGMVPMRAFDKVTPLDILPSPLFRALLVRDTDQAQALGCLELDSEDLSLCSFLCPAKNDYGAALRLNLEKIEREG
jgi:Na+-transporting NADH:ubiquinone oxidoreductase subunit A